MAGAVTAALVALTATLSLTTGSVDTPRSGERAELMYVLGDSWSAGLYADPDHTLAQDAADELGIGSVVDAQSGTGYLSAPVGAETYPERASAITVDAPVRLVVIQGGSNDADDDLDGLPAAVARTIAAVHRTLPHAEVVLLGPGPDPWPITGRQRAVDDVLHGEASREGVPYISPMREGWFTETSTRAIIDPATDHPTVQGDEILGRRLASDLRTLLLHRTAAPATATTPEAAAVTRALRARTAARWSLSME